MENLGCIREKIEETIKYGKYPNASNTGFDKIKWIKHSEFRTIKKTHIKTLLLVDFVTLSSEFNRQMFRPSSIHHPFPSVFLSL